MDLEAKESKIQQGVKYFQPCHGEKYYKQMEEEVKKSLELKKNEHLHYKESRDMTEEQKKELFGYFLKFMEDRFNKPFQDVILTKDSNFGFKNESYLLKCHTFLKALRPENINWKKTFFKFSPYGEYSLNAYLSEEDFIQFFHIGGKTTTFRFSFDLLGNTFTLKYPNPLPGKGKEIMEYETESEDVKIDEKNPNMKIANSVAYRQQLVLEGELEKEINELCDKLETEYLWNEDFTEEQEKALPDEAKELIKKLEEKEKYLDSIRNV